MSTPTPEPTLAEVLTAITELRAEVAALPERLMLTQVPGLDDGTKKARPLRGVLAVLNNRGAAIRSQLADLQRVVDGGQVDQ